MVLIKDVNFPRNPRGVFDVKKISIKGDKTDWEEVTLTYNTYGEGSQMSETKFNCKESPAKSFPDALSELIIHAVELCGLGHEWEDIGYISDVRVKHLIEGITVSLVAKCQIGDRIVAVTTPAVFPRDQYLTRLNTVLAEAEDYIKGRRAQQSLFPVENTKNVG